MATKNITIRVSEDTFEFLGTVFENPTAGATMSVQMVEQMIKQVGATPNTIVNSIQFLQQVRAYSTRELRGLFTADEWKYMADSLNGTMITPEFRCNQGGLIASVEDSNDFDKLADKWQVNVSELISKIKTLTGAQVDAVYTHVEKFWSETGRGLADLNNWSKSL